jgi:hypothetical protein
MQEEDEKKLINIILLILSIVCVTKGESRTVPHYKNMHMHEAYELNSRAHIGY